MNPDLKTLSVEELGTLLKWLDGSPVYEDFCKEIRAEIRRRM